MINEYDIKDMWPSYYIPLPTVSPDQPPSFTATWSDITRYRQQPEQKRANDKQVGGDHYKKHGDLQPWDVVDIWGLGYFDGTALKYIARWKDKGGIQDIQKAIHFLEKLIEVTNK